MALICPSQPGASTYSCDVSGLHGLPRHYLPIFCLTGFSPPPLQKQSPAALQACLGQRGPLCPVFRLRLPSQLLLHAWDLVGVYFFRKQPVKRKKIRLVNKWFSTPAFSIEIYVWLDSWKVRMTRTRLTKLILPPNSFSHLCMNLQLMSRLEATIEMLWFFKYFSEIENHLAKYVLSKSACTIWLL